VKRAIACLLAAACGAAAAADDARTQAQQRIALVARLVADSPAAQRIATSGQSLAVSHLDESKLHLARAQDAFKAGDYAAARKAADEALGHLGMARRMAPDAPSRQQALRQRQEQQQAAIDRLIEAWRERALAAGKAGDADLVDAIGLAGSARALAQGARYEEALQQLAAAQARVLAGMTRLYADARDLDYTQRAATPAEALRIEMAQYSALADLLPTALAEMKPRPDAQALIERYRLSALALHHQAQQSYERGDSADALASLRSAALYLQRALSAAGVVTPNPTGDNP
jgi:hypothetical protein